MSPIDRKLRDHVQPGLSVGRMHRQWAGISGRLRRRSAAARLLPIGLAAVAAAVIAALWLRGPSTAREGAEIAATAARSSEVTLSDESVVKVAPGGRLKVSTSESERIVVDLSRGRARFEVSKDPRRAFVVRAASVEVHVIGTEFDVSLEEGGEVRVSVWEGVVRVRRSVLDAPDIVLRAEDTWSTKTPTPPDASPPSEAQAEVAPEEAPDEAPVPEDMETAPGDPDATLNDTGVDDPEAAGTHTEEQRDRPSSRGTKARPTRTKPSSDDAQMLFEQARHALLKHRYADAARQFDALRRRYPTDPRAALAALELGRLRLDHLDDARGAVEALDAALRLAQVGTLKEDVEARLVQALEASGADGRCRSARDGYLARYPRGAHRIEVAARCQGR